MRQTSLATPSEFAELVAEYEFLGELGRGGSAVVYRGHDRGLGRDVAIKVVHPRPLSPDDDAVARLAREARTIAQLQHPNIVTVYAVRRLTGGGLALVMQLVPGRTLKAVVLEDGPLSPERCERILRDVAAALAYAHSRGVVHRDVKPENIFVDEATGHILLADFGIARSVEHDSSTLTGTAIGTPFYMSPEQIDGGAIDGRSDLYSLGLVAWEMLTGRRPWDGESLYNVIAKQKQEELPPIEALRAGVPLRLQYIIERMLQKNPAARWAGAEGLLSQLSHSVLPSDYGRWQATLRKRAERFHAAERERVRERPVDVAADGGGLLASTMRFVRGTPLRGTTAGEFGPQLGDTMVVSVDGKVKALVASTEPAVATDGDATPTTAPPSWATRRPPRPRRILAAALGVTGVVVATTMGLQALSGGRVRRAPAAQAAPPPSLPSDSRRAVPPSIDGVAPDADRTPPAAPVPALGTAGETVIALGARHSCVVDRGGAILCWGANDRGQLGNGAVTRQLAPTRVTADLRFASVTAGGSHSCGLTVMADVYCWGSDAHGQLGDATGVRRNAPVRIAGPGIYRSVRAGESHTCALRVDGQVDCWGANDRGQLGDATDRPRNTPAAADVPRAERFVEVAVGASHSCARTEAGALYCWGANDRGQLGVSGADRHTATLVPDTARFVALAAGAAHTCGLTVQGTVRCWGGNARGQLGRGERSVSSGPASVRLPAPAARVVAGALHTCALLGSGEAMCWGANGVGQLGTPGVVDAVSPARVATNDRFVALGAGGAHTCAVTSRGVAVCWGEDRDGQLGDGSRIARRIPEPVVAKVPPTTTRPD